MDTQMFYFDEINFQMIFKKLWRSKLWIILGTICLFAGTFVYQQKTHVDRYSSKATVSVQSDDDMIYDDFEDSKEYAKTYVSAFKGSRMLSLAKSVTGITSGEIALSASQRGSTNLIEVTATASDAEKAYLIMDAIVNHYSEVIDTMYLSGNAHFVQEATEAVKVSSAPDLKKPLVMAALGFVGSIVIIAGSALLKNTVKTKSCAKRRLSGQCLGVIDQVAGKEVLPITADGADIGFVDDMYVIANQVERQMQVIGKKSLLVSSTAKQEGSTTVAKNLALALREKGRKVELIDCSQNENPEVLIAEYSQKADYVIVDAKAMSESIDAEVLSYMTEASLLVVKQDCTKLKNIQEALWKLEESTGEYLGYVLNGWTTAS